MKTSIESQLCDGLCPRDPCRLFAVNLYCKLGEGAGAPHNEEIFRFCLGKYFPASSDGLKNEVKVFCAEAADPGSRGGQMWCLSIGKAKQIRGHRAATGNPQTLTSSKQTM